MGEATDFRSVVGLLVFEHAEDGVQEFAHDGDQGLHFQFGLRLQVFIESSQMGVAADGDERRPIETSAQVSVAGLADADFFAQRSSGRIFARIEAGVGDPLAHVEAEEIITSSARIWTSLVSPMPGMLSSA